MMKTNGTVTPEFNKSRTRAHSTPVQRVTAGRFTLRNREEERKNGVDCGYISGDLGGSSCPRVRAETNNIQALVIGPVAMLSLFVTLIVSGLLHFCVNPATGKSDKFSSNTTVLYNREPAARSLDVEAQATHDLTNIFIQIICEYRIIFRYIERYMLLGSFFLRFAKDSINIANRTVRFSEH